MKADAGRDDAGSRRALSKVRRSQAILASVGCAAFVLLGLALGDEVPWYATAFFAVCLVVGVISIFVAPPDLQAREEQRATAEDEKIASSARALAEQVAWPDIAVRLRVGIGPRLLESADGGRSWTEGVRVVPPRTEPEIRGAQVGLDKPPVPPNGALSHVYIGGDGIGFAAGYEPLDCKGERHRRARFWLTRDRGATWQAMQPDIGWWGRLRAGYGWPPEEIESVAVLGGGVVAFIWEDPWLFEGPNTHLVLSADGGATWRYRRAPGGFWAAWGPGPLRIFGGARVAERTTSGSFRRDAYRLAWDLPPGYWRRNLPPRSVQFASETDGFGIIVTWPRNDPSKTPEQLPPPLVGLARTQDGGRLWKVVSTWEGPRSTDLNVRHVVVLDVG